MKRKGSPASCQQSWGVISSDPQEQPVLATLSCCLILTWDGFYFHLVLGGGGALSTLAETQRKRQGVRCGLLYK